MCHKETTQTNFQLQVNYLRLRSFVESSSHAYMPATLFSNMLKLVPEPLQIRYPQLMSDMRAEIMEEYERSIREFTGTSFQNFVVFHEQESLSFFFTGQSEFQFCSILITSQATELLYSEKSL